MRTFPFPLRAARWASLPATLGLLAQLVACGSPAHRDFDLNEGEARGERAPMASREFVLPSGEADRVYELAAGDKLEIVFFTHPEQDRFVTVRPDGRISLPFLGDLLAAGKEPEVLAGEIQEGYREVLVNPRVDVIVQETGAPFFVVGEVNAPGQFKLEHQLDVVQAVARAGGYTETARLDNFVLIRRTGDGEGVAAILDFRQYLADPAKRGNTRLEPYDIVWVPRSRLSRWDLMTRQAFLGANGAADAVLKGWGLANFEEVYIDGPTRP